MEKEQNDEVEIDLVEIFTLLKEKIIKIFGIGVILAALIGIGTLFLIKPKYESTSKLYIVGETNSIMSLTSLQAGSQLAQDYIHIVQSRPVLEKVISNLNLDMEYDEEMDFQLVGSTEANSLQGKISNESPVGKALIGAKQGDVVDVELADGDIMQYKVLKIERNI